jgi:hypothetical protein
MCLTRHDLHQGRLFQELLLMVFWIVAAMWFFDIAIDKTHVSMVSTAAAGYAGCHMVYSPESMEQYFWPKIWAMAAVALFSGLLLYQASFAR